MVRLQETNQQVDLVLLGSEYETGQPLPQWPLGKVWVSRDTPVAVHEIVQAQLSGSTADAWLFWHAELGMPNPHDVAAILRLPGDLWHAGLRLKMQGLPAIIDYIMPTWMLNCDPDPTIEATSWRLSLHACLVKTDVLRQMGVVRPDFQTLDAAALEMGHRYITRGVLMRHIPWLVRQEISTQPPKLPYEDSLRFAYYRFGRVWSYWAQMRALMSGSVSPMRALQAISKVYRKSRPIEPGPFARQAPNPPVSTPDPRVSVLIPTVDRYPYLRVLLGQMRTQTILPCEIIIVDQTPQVRRDISIQDDFGDLPLKLLYLDEAGQCSSRNLGLETASGDYILFADDDIEVEMDFVASHLSCLRQFQQDVCSGVVTEPEYLTKSGPHEAFIRVSNVFPMGNTMVKRSALCRSGLLDLAYDHGQRADGDLGMRVYLSGALMILDPRISVLHHHAPIGGLRTHNARVITYASSRQKLKQRHLPSVTEIYLAMRYFTPRQLHNMFWLRTLGTFSIRGGAGKKLLKLLTSMAYLPNTLWETRKRRKEAIVMLEDFPQIPALYAIQPYMQPSVQDSERMRIIKHGS